MKKSELIYKDIEKLIEEYIQNGGEITYLPYIDENMNATEIDKIRKEERKRIQKISENQI